MANGRILFLILGILLGLIGLQVARRFLANRSKSDGALLQESDVDQDIPIPSLH